jgi:polyisoprenoid-binding protein YceI
MNRKALMLAAAGSLSISGVALAQSGALTRTPSEVRSGSYVLDPAHGKITWSVSHLGFSTYVGQFTDVKANLELNSTNPVASKLEASVAMASVGTFSDGLNKHLQTADFFDAAKHPVTSFRATSVRQTDADSADIAGNLTLRGVTKPILIQADFNQAGVNPVDKSYTVGFDGRAKIKRSDFGISYGLPLLGDEVTLRFEAEFKAKSLIQTKGAL